MENEAKQISEHSTGLQKYENKKARNESNKCNPYAGANNYHLTKQRQAAVCLSAQHELRLLELSLVRM